MASLPLITYTPSTYKYVDMKCADKIRNLFEKDTTTFMNSRDIHTRIMNTCYSLTDRIVGNPAPNADNVITHLISSMR